ncbi:MAG: FKBP-type peptidyl-prolyl cis-trans isomerase [Solimonas sp.]
MKIDALRLAWPLALLLLAACNDGDLREAQGPAPTSTTADGLMLTELTPGDGSPIGAGSIAVVHYTGWLYEDSAQDNKGNKFDSSVDRNEPFRFVLGRGDVIRGWDRGVEGMKVGGKRRLVIPAALAYGERGAGNVIPPGATLVFDVELVGIEPATPGQP